MLLPKSARFKMTSPRAYSSPAGKPLAESRALRQLSAMPSDERPARQGDAGDDSPFAWNLATRGSAGNFTTTAGSTDSNESSDAS
jgi:hypothetical protein